MGVTRWKGQGHISPLLHLFEGRGKKGRCDLVCGGGAPVDDWAKASFYLDVLFMCGECVFSFLGSWSFSKE